MFKSLTKNQIAFLIFFLITFIYLFPMFLGMVDTPVDIRDIRMYPWRYYAVDKKIKQVALWEPSSDLSLFQLRTPASSSNKIVLDFKLKDADLKKLGKLSDTNYFLTFDFKVDHDKSVAFDFGVHFVNSSTQEIFKPGVAIIPLTPNKADKVNEWYRGQFTLNDLVGKLDAFKDLDNYKIEILTKNKSSFKPSVLNIKNLKLAYDDFSKVVKVHNHYNNDLIQMFTPLREYFSNSIMSGKLPFWNNNILCGTEFLAEPQVGYCHPLYFLLYFLFDHFTAHQVLLFICLFLCGFGTFLLASYWGLDFSASLLTAIVYMFQPFNATWFSYEHVIMNTAFMPFLLLFYDKNIKSKNLLNKYLIASSALLGLLFLSGHLQYINYSFIFFLLFVLFKLLLEFFNHRKNIVKHMFSIFFVSVLGIMIGSIVLFPFYDLFQNSHRTTNPEDFIRITSIPLKAFIGLICPFYMGFPEWPLSGIINRDPAYDAYKMGFFRNYVYFGFLPFLFLFFSIKTLLKNKLTMFFFCIIIISLLISTGSPAYFLIRDFIPGFKEMQHYRFLMLYSYSVPFLAGIGLQVFINIFKNNEFKKYLLTLILLISVLDLMFCSSYFVTWSKRDECKPLYKGGVLEFISLKQKESKEPFRVLPFVSHLIEKTYIRPDIAEPNTLFPYGIEDFSGYSSVIPKDIYYTYVYIQTKDLGRLYSGKIYDLFSNINTPYPISNFHSMIIDLSNVRYFIVPSFLTLDSKKVNKVFEGDCTVYENKNCFPRAFVVLKYKVIESPKDTIVELDSEGFDAKKEVILMTHPRVIASPHALLGVNSAKQSRLFLQEQIGIAEPAPNKVRGLLRNDNALKYEVNFLKYEGENIVLDVETNKPGFLILGHNLNNNWRVKINGKEDKHFQANLIQRAVYLPKAGDYKVEFYYFPKLFLIGLGITSLALIIIFSLLFYLSLRQT